MSKTSLRMRMRKLVWLWTIILLPALALAATPAPVSAPVPKSSPAPVAKQAPPTAAVPPPKVASPKAAPAPVAPAPKVAAPKAAPAPVAPAPKVAAPKAAPKAAAPKVAAPVPSKAAPPPKIAAPKAAPKAAPVPSKAAPPPKHSNVTSPSPSVRAPPPKAKSPATSPATSPALSPSPSIAPSPFSGTSTLDPSQLSALRALKVNFSGDPCATPSKIFVCDNKSPKHLLALELEQCPAKSKLSTDALANLTTLKAISFLDCPMTPEHVPSKLIDSLTSFTCVESLGRTGQHETMPKLSGVWLSKFTNLNDITVTDVEVNVSGLVLIVTPLQALTQLTIARANVPGRLPKKTWPADLVTLDVSGNSIRGTIPSEMQMLTQLKELYLHDNQLTGVIPNIFGSLSNLQNISLANNQLSGSIPGSLAEVFNLTHLDLSNNKLNGSILANISKIKTLRYLDLSQNDLTGPIPFNNTFLNRLTTFNIKENAGVCYNHSALKSKFLAGIPNCVTESDNVLAPAPAPALESERVSTGSSHTLSKGGIVGISVVAIVVGVALAVGISKWRNREDPDKFENLRSQRQ